MTTNILATIVHIADDEMSLTIVKCPQCDREYEWANGTETEYWCQHCGCEAEVKKEEAMTPEPPTAAPENDALELARNWLAEPKGHLAPFGADAMIDTLAVEVIRLTTALAEATRKGEALDALIQMTNGYPLEYFLHVKHANERTSVQLSETNIRNVTRSGEGPTLAAAILAADRRSAGEGVK